ncbi:PREDICTED: venom carboxylesterase-6 [Polistes canadensis]|uniref:venom carboxylesterase-6 n=1 Tax=Polistes canadensis TaxID=91411 RepID=UPI000718C8E2|nr:PREDICTED: venom carboxylesterase-6 [Polistes canadensis]
MLPKYQFCFWTLAILLCLSSLLSFVHSTSCQNQQDEEPKVRIKNGTLNGLIMKTRHGRKFDGFLGIPYALPPIGKLRFELPQPMTAWKGTRDAKKDAEICTQRNIYTDQEEIVGTEDCLYLNVYTPKLPKTKEDKNPLNSFPVMVWFHGGGWVTGAGHSEFYGPKFFLDHDVVLVTMNFRLGPLGFLSTEDLVCPGNLGLKDQVQVLRWINENIAEFGGDPNRVTIFGESAGGASVHYHMMSNLSKGLFHRAISQSGTAHCPWTLTRQGTAKIKAQSVGKLVNCPTDDSKALIECLRTKDAYDIIGTDRHFQKFGYCPMIPFRPVIEPDHPNAFITKDPAIITKLGEMTDIPWMTGITSEEGSLKVPSLYTKSKGELIKRMNDEFANIAPVTLLHGETCPDYLHDKISLAIREFYFQGNPIDNSTRMQVVDMYSDAWFNHGARTAIRDYFKTQSSPIYFYYFAYKGSVSFSKIFGDDSADYGVTHADDLHYLFPVGEQLFKEISPSKEDQKMIDTMTSLWFNFAKTGNPTPEITNIITEKWKPVRTEALEYYYINNTKLSMSRDLHPKRREFWDNLPACINQNNTNEMHFTIKEEL